MQHDAQAPQEECRVKGTICRDILNSGEEKHPGTDDSKPIQVEHSDHGSQGVLRVPDQFEYFEPGLRKQKEQYGYFHLLLRANIMQSEDL